MAEAAGQQKKELQENRRRVGRLPLAKPTSPAVGLVSNGVTTDMVIDERNSVGFRQFPAVEGFDHEPAGLRQGQDGHRAPFFPKR